MTTSAIFLMIAALAFLWGGLAISIVHLNKYTASHAAARATEDAVAGDLGQD